MNKNQSKKVGIVFIVLALIGLAYFGWYLFKNDNITNGIFATNSTKKTTPSTTPSTKTDDSTATTTPTTADDWSNFAQDDINFTFKYPKTWTLDLATATAMTGSPEIKQKTVKIKTANNINFRFDNPATATGFEEYDLKNAKDITAGALTFKRDYGQNTSGQTLYIATYTDPNNLDASSVSFYGIGTIDTATINSLDSLVSSFSFK